MDEIGTIRAQKTPIRSLIEIGLLLAYLYFAPGWLEAVVVKSGIEVSGYVQIIGITALDIVFFILAWLILKARGEGLKDVGFARPKSIAFAICVGLIVAALSFVAAEAILRAGIWTRDPSRVPAGSYGLLAAWLGFEALVPGIVEEFIYRGVIMDRIAKAFGGTNGGWAIAVIGQAVIFSLAHGYNGLEGLEVGLGTGLINGLVFLLVGRNLWASIIAHNTNNVARIAYAYYLLSHPL